MLFHDVMNTIQTSVMDPKKNNHTIHEATVPRYADLTCLLMCFAVKMSETQHLRCVEGLVWGILKCQVLESW
jgi:hypothetical protein